MTESPQRNNRLNRKDTMRRLAAYLSRFVPARLTRSNSRFGVYYSQIVQQGNAPTADEARRDYINIIRNREIRGWF